ncbi:NYN domain-containing protein [Candidatus Giovannonibacteria bacterium]|nr:NYN domain-containing protein [Candidatus Giovannonibacteria bacterium]
MTKKEIVAVYIDGSNTYKRLKGLGIPDKSLRFDLSFFVKHLVGERTLISKRYYIGIVRNVDNSEKAEKMAKSQQKFLESLRTEGFDVNPGKIMYDGGRIREKGVDVKLSVDLVIGAVDSIYDTAIVVSSDTDLIPAIKYVRNVKGKVVEYVGFGTNPSLGMIKESSVSRVFSLTDLAQFQSKTIKFRDYLTGLILKGEKTTTWRLFDDKNLLVGDLLNFQIWETGKDFAKAKIIELKEKKLKEIVAKDYDGHEKLKDQESMLNHFREFYGNKVNLETTVKIVKFNLVSKQ